jgi:hypothetical protein
MGNNTLLIVVMEREIEIMRTQEEIVARIKVRRNIDFLGLETLFYYPYLDYIHAKEFINPEVTKDIWNKDMEESISSKQIEDYMPFAWDKANNCRGLSAHRSIMHFIAWVWLDGDDSGWLEKDYNDNYEYYGKPQLVKICEKYDIDWKKLDNDRWTNSESEEGITAKEALKR